MSNFLCPFTKQQFFLNNGAFNSQGYFYSYYAGTNTPAPTYTATGLTNPNPVILDSRGAADIWLANNVGYKINVTDASGNTLNNYPVDNIIIPQLITLYGGVDFGVTNIYAISFAGNFTSLTNGIVIYFIASNSNTGPSTLSVNLFGIQPIISQNGQPLSAGQISGGQAVGVMYYNGNWLLISSPSQLPSSGTFQGTVTGGSNAPLTCPYSISGSTANITLPQCAFTSTATTFTLTGLPTILQPATNKVVPLAVMENNGAYITNANAAIGVLNIGSIVFQIGATAAGWTASGIKGIGYTSGIYQIGVTLAYNLL